MMARSRNLAPNRWYWVPLALGLLIACSIGGALFAARPALGQDQDGRPKSEPGAGGIELPPALPDVPQSLPEPRKAAVPTATQEVAPPRDSLPPVPELAKPSGAVPDAKPAARVGGIELPPALPDVPQSRPEPPGTVVPAAATQEVAPPRDSPPPVPEQAKPSGPGPEAKPIGGILDGSIVTAPSPANPTQSTPTAKPPVLPEALQLPPGVPPPPAPGLQREPGLTPGDLPAGPAGNATPPELPSAVPLLKPPAVELSGHGSITIRVADESIRKALELLSAQGGVNILSSIGVAGNVTLNLKNVTFDEALDALVKVGNLGVRREGSILYVYTAQELADLDIRMRVPVVRVYCLNYIRASDLSQMIRPFLSQEGSLSVTPANSSGIGSGTASGAAAANSSGAAATFAGSAGSGAPGAGNGTGLSGGNVSSGGTSAAGSTIATGSETGGNSMAGGDSMIVRDYADNIAQIDEIVAKLDVQPLQVLIEAVIISVDLNNTQQLGMNFSLVDKLQNVAAVGGNGNFINAAAGFSPAKVLTTAAAVAPSLLPRPGQLVSGYLSPDQGLKFGFISQDVSGFIRAIETFNKINVLASPRVLVLNKQRAEIQLGQRLGYRNTVTNLTSSLQTVQFLSVGTLLSLRPFVSRDGMVRMEIHPEKSTGGLDSNGIPQTNTSELTTNILVPDGATIVIGGLIDSSDQNLQQGVLGLSRLPVLGPLFRDRTTKAIKTELIVLLTPRILNRAGLPEPHPGLAPVGPSGIPNSGPMPGPPVFAGMPGLLPDQSGLPMDATNEPLRIFDVAGPVTGAKLNDYQWIGASGSPSEAARTDDRIQTASFQPNPEKAKPVLEPVQNPIVSSDEREIPIVVTAAPLTETRKVGRPDSDQAEKSKSRQGYRPGDLTRGLVAKLKAKTTDAKATSKARPTQPMPPRPDKPLREPEVVRTSAVVAATFPPKPSLTLPDVQPPAQPHRHPPHVHVQTPDQDDMPMPARSLANAVGAVGVTYRWHTVQAGEDFGKLAEQHFGSSSLRSALWQVNRHLVPSPRDLTPGTMILIPPAEVLDRLVEEATMKSLEDQDDSPSGSVSQNQGRKIIRIFPKP